MRSLRRLAVAALAVAAGLASPMSALAGPERRETPERREALFGAHCFTDIRGPWAVVSCHNPYPAGDLVRLHIECDRWWDVDMDTRPVEVGPAETVELSGRCWMEIREVWVTHSRNR